MIHIVLILVSSALSIILSWFTLITIKENRLLKMQNEILAELVYVFEKEYFSHGTNNEEDKKR